MLRICRLWESPLVRVDRIDHPPDVVHVDPVEEMSSQYSVNLLERGSFSVVHRSRTWTVGAAEMFITVPGQVHRYVHDGDAPTDSCIAVCFDESSWVDADAIGSLQDLPPVVSLNNRRAYLRLRLFDRLAHGGDSLGLELLAGELLQGAFDGDARPLYRSAQLAWYARRIDAARQRLDEDFASDHSLQQLARDAGMSPFHFARVFRQLAGLPPHRYLLRRRMNAAAAMLRGGASVTDTCFAVGFQSLSHFVRAFRQTYGVQPSRWRRT